MDIRTAQHAVLSFALVTLASGCTPDSSVGSDSLPAQGGDNTVPTGEAGGSSAGTSALGTSGASGSTAGSGSGGSDASTAGNGGSGGSDSIGGAAGIGASGSGAIGGASTGGGAGQGGPSLCPVAGTTLCDGFENDAPGAANSPFTVDVAKGDTMVVDTTKFYRGSKSMKFSAASQAYIVASKIFTGTTKATNNNLWGRYFMLSNVPMLTTYSMSHVVFGALADSANSGTQFHFVGGSRRALQAEIRLASDAYTDSMTAPAAADPPFPVVADGWQCWEWQVTADDSYDFYLNGKEVPEMKITAGKAVMSKQTFAPMPVFGGLYLGWQSFGGGTVISGWIDEVAVGPNRIGCGS